MTLTPILRNQIAFYSKILAASALIGALISALLGNALAVPDLIQGAISGLVIGLGCSMSELAIATIANQRWSRRFPLVLFVVIRAVGFSLSIVIGLTGPIFVLTGAVFWRDPSFGFVFGISILASSAFSIAIEITRHLGKEATISLLTGRYRRPRLEERIVLFADLIGSTSLAERIGDLRFHKFLGDVAFDLARPVELAGGDVHRYVGDAVIVTWPLNRRNAANAAVECAAQMHSALAKAAPGYQTRFGAAPHLRIAIHCGPVAAGEVGDWKKEIALLGDTMNTAARLEGAARDLGARTVLSDDLRHHLSETVRSELAPLPSYAASGKRDRVAIWAAGDGSSDVPDP